MMAVEIKFSFLNLSIATIFYAEMSADTKAGVFFFWGGGGGGAGVGGRRGNLMTFFTWT